jgi:PPK2 family polyphosphate:nucleotide phosphotransferase
MKHILVTRPGKKIHLRETPTDDTAGLDDKAASLEVLADELDRLRKLQHLLYADGRYALLVVLQAMDTGGKDGTIRHVMSGFNPAGCNVTSFKQPSAEEREHDYLWRAHHAVPPRGVVGVFNRSHYEDVLIVRVHKLVSREEWEPRYRQINDFERMLSENGVHILKFFLHISKGEQERRLKARLKDPTKNWKFSEGDLFERKSWAKYQIAYEDAINRCTTEWAPWHIVPADHKWVRDVVVAQAMRKALESLDLRYPKPLTKTDLARIRIR